MELASCVECPGESDIQVLGQIMGASTWPADEGGRCAKDGEGSGGCQVEVKEDGVAAICWSGLVSCGGSNGVWSASSGPSGRLEPLVQPSRLRRGKIHPAG